MRFERHQREPEDIGGGMIRQFDPEWRRLPAPQVVPAEHRRAIDRREPDPRIALAKVIDGSKESYAALSRMLGKPNHFLRRFVLHGVPTELHADDHRQLADFFGLDERGLGVRDLWKKRS
jgi:hypothetical protein